MKSKTVKIILPLLALIVIITAGIYYHFYLLENIIHDMKSYIERVNTIENAIISSVPIYQDYATPGRERKLRTFLLYDHIKVAQKTGVDPIQNDNEMKKLIDNKKLIPVKTGDKYLYYFYGVKKKYRYLTPRALKGLDTVAQRFQENLKKQTATVPVKLAVSSAIRTITYQTQLRSENRNAANRSSHYYGVSFDIFFDDYFVQLPVYPSSSNTSRKVQLLLRRKFGFILGDTLRRQFKSVLMETLLQLQDEGKLYAILERRQKCYHITVL